jgi:hypothetical protein
MVEHQTHNLQDPGSSPGSPTKLKKIRFVKLRVCASCEWIFNAVNNDPTCPKCEFGSYSAKYVYGKRAYQYKITQLPYVNKKLEGFRYNLMKEVEENNKKQQKDIFLTLRGT